MINEAFFFFNNSQLECRQNGTSCILQMGQRIFCRKWMYQKIFNNAEFYQQILVQVVSSCVSYAPTSKF